MNSEDFKKYQEIMAVFKEIINVVTTFDIGQLKLFFVNLEKKILNKEQGIYSEYVSLKQMLDQFKQGKGKVTIHFAVARGDIDIVKHLVDNLKLDLNIKDGDGNTPFFTAVEHQNLPMVQYFIEELKYNPNTLKQGEISCLHLACNHKSEELIRYLINKGSDVEKVSIYGKPINWAAGSSNVMAIKVLLENKANPNGDLTCPAPAPFILAIDFGNKEMYDLLISHGADVNVRDPHGYSTLHVAAEKGNLEIVKDLIERGVEVQYEVQGKSALFLAFQNHKFPVVNYLKQKSKNFQAVQNKIKQMKLQQQRYQQNKPKAQQIKQVGNKFYSQKKYQQALVEYKKALQFDRDNTVIHRNMAACYLSLKQFQEALHSCQLAKVGDPKNVKTLYRQAQAYAGLGNLVEATANFWECSMLEPQTELFKIEFHNHMNLAKKMHGKQ